MLNNTILCTESSAANSKQNSFSFLKTWLRLTAFEHTAYHCLLKTRDVWGSIFFSLRRKYIDVYNQTAFFSSWILCLPLRSSYIWGLSSIKIIVNDLKPWKSETLGKPYHYYHSTLCEQNGNCDWCWGSDLQWESTLRSHPVACSQLSSSTDACPPRSETAGSLREK